MMLGYPFLGLFCSKHVRRSSTCGTLWLPPLLSFSMELFRQLLFTELEPLHPPRSQLDLSIISSQNDEILGHGGWYESREWQTYLACSQALDHSVEASQASIFAFFELDFYRTYWQRRRLADWAPIREDSSGSLTTRMWFLKYEALQVTMLLFLCLLLCPRAESFACFPIACFPIASSAENLSISYARRDSKVCRKWPLAIHFFGWLYIAVLFAMAVQSPSAFCQS